MSKIQDLKGTHNAFLRSRNLRRSCFWCQRYKIWKELTTWSVCISVNALLFLMSKIQDLKGTHNAVPLHELNAHVVSDVKDTRFERNSQPFKSFVVVVDCCFWCQRYKIWKELTTVPMRLYNGLRCFWCQRYKIWKELTTVGLLEYENNKLFLMSKIQDLKGTHNSKRNCWDCAWLFLMSKIQDLKGTHNPWQKKNKKPYVVSDVKDTRFERNSQLTEIYR